MNNILSARAALIALGFAATLSIGAQFAHAAPLTRTLDLGATGSDVSSLQTYLATNGSIYPEGLVTGYFGALTQAAVQRFQTAQGIVTSGTPATTGYGRVGPTTLARINSLMAGGVVSSDAAPIIGAPSAQVGSNAATITWATNEPTQGQLYWSTSPIQSDEATGPRQQPFVSGTLAVDPSGVQTSHSVTLTGLQANTTYYFLVRGVDVSGNMSMVLPTTFHTNN